MRRKQFLALLTICTMLLGLAGCGGDNEEEIINTEQVDEQTDTEALPEIEQETVLPPTMTMNDLLNMIQINGKTLTMPTTLNDIMALDDGFSYNMESNLEECKEYNVGIIYNISYNDVFITDVYMLLDDYDPDDPENARIITFADEINTHRCDEAGISFQLGDIDFSSDKDDIIKFLGAGESEKFTKGEKIRYSFYDELYKLNIFLFISNETDTVSAITYNLIIKDNIEENNDLNIY